jgi:hypothetical protein
MSEDILEQYILPERCFYKMKKGNLREKRKDRCGNGQGRTTYPFQRIKTRHVRKNILSSDLLNRAGNLDRRDIIFEWA